MPVARIGAYDGSQVISSQERYARQRTCANLVSPEAAGPLPDWQGSSLRTPLSIVQDAKDFLRSSVLSPLQPRLRGCIDSAPPFEESVITPLGDCGRASSAASMATTAVPTPGACGSRACSGGPLGFGLLAPPSRAAARLPALASSVARGLNALGAASRSSSASAGYVSRGGYGSFGGAAFGLGATTSAARATSVEGGRLGFAALLSPAGALPSPPRTDPPRRRRRKKGNSRRRYSLPDSPLPLPPQCSERGMLLSAGSNDSLEGLDDVATVQSARQALGPPVPVESEKERAPVTSGGQATLVIDTDLVAADSDGEEVEESIVEAVPLGAAGSRAGLELEPEVQWAGPPGEEEIDPPGEEAVDKVAEDAADLDQVWSAQGDGKWAPDVLPSAPGAEAAAPALAEEGPACPDLLGCVRVRSDCDYWDNSSHFGNDVDSVDGRACRADAVLTPSSLGVSKNFDSERNSVDDGQADAAGTIRGGSFKWLRGELIGRGSLGSVWKALNSQTGELMAVKEVVIDTRDSTDNKFRQSLQNEIDLYKDLQHPNIVSYLGNDFINGRLYIYLEYMSGGSISQVLSQFGPLEESLVARYLQDLLQGLEYLHSREHPVLHRDIKGANILVGLDSTVKLSDFGASKKTGGTANHTLRGSVPWMAPEVMRQEGYGRKADIWSLGCVVIEMATASQPWGQFDNCLAAMVRIAMSEETPPVPEQLSPPCRDLISQCTRRSPEERPGASQLLEHEFVKGGLAAVVDESWGP
eukprot:TRINITY_DN77557_c0_g1_i1.p1 TRINITY_DN77557_c0_g1~~TRINITY_DN77557_c0_g1_i1.p1  ORF type:complete len:794 (+),score=158.31 TRINITY_DN77557_c0_g1_i1:117-2384(+)